MNDYKKFITPQCRALSLFAKRKKPIPKFRSTSFTPLNNLNIFTIQGSIFQNNSLRRKSCHCKECGCISKFQYKYMNLNYTPQQRRKVQLQLRSENHRQTKNSTFSKYRTIIMNQVRKSKLEQQFLPSEENTPKDTEVKESLNKLREYFAKQEQQKKKIKTRSLRYIVNKTPGQSPRGYKSPQQKDFIPYLSYRRIELIHLKPLKFSDTLKSFQTHKKTMSSQL